MAELMAGRLFSGILTGIFSAVIFPVLAGSTAHAGMLKETYRGARPMAMGNAYVGLADDENSVWYNPAGLAGNKEYVFHYAVTDLTISTDVIATTSSVTNFSNLSGDTVNALMGKDIYGQAQFASTLMMPNFGVSFLWDGQAALQAKNKALPDLLLGYQKTTGIQAAYGFSTAKKGHRKRGEFRFGLAAKALTRRGGYRTIPLTSLMSIGKDKLSEIVGESGTGYGGDVGMQYLRPVGRRLTLSFGSALSDIGDTSFGPGPDKIPQNLTAGVAGQYDMTIGKASLTYDWRHILDKTDWRKKSHLGLEWQLPMLSVFGGLDQMFLTYGVSFDAWIVKVTAVSYEEENGSFIKQDPERRYTLRLALRFNL